MSENTKYKDGMFRSIFSSPYEDKVNRNAIYKQSRIKLYRPDFIVLYNGTDPLPEEMTLRLSESFKEMPEALSLGGRIELEMRVVNINKGYNKDILEHCKSLDEYATFVAKVRKYQSGGHDLKTAITRAVMDSLEENILVDFLSLHASEVYNMMTLVYNQEDAVKYAREEGREEGRERH